MRIKELHLKNYRPFKDFTVQFSQQVTVIAGINGQGKSSILEALAILISRLLPQISPAKGGYRSFSGTDIYLGEKRTDLGMRVNCAGLPVVFEGWYAQDDQRQRFTQLTKPFQREIRNAYGNDKSRSDDAAPIAVYYTTDRAGFNQPRRLGRFAPQGQAAAYHRALVKKRVDFKDFMLWYRVCLSHELNLPLNRSTIYGRIIELLERTLRVFLPDFSDLKVEFTDVSPRLIMKKAGIGVTLGQLSDGERSFLAMITDLCKRLCRANPNIDPLSGEGVVLIDELELHLHPTWQREIVDKLRQTFPKLQFITTTHSPFVIQSLRSGELVNLKPEEFEATQLLPEAVLDEVEGQQPEYSDQSVEDIAEEVMGVDMPQKSVRYQKMMQVAEEYFKLLRRPVKERGSIEELKLKLDELSAPFSDDPAYQALLKVERELNLEGGQNAAG